MKLFGYMNKKTNLYIIEFFINNQLVSYRKLNLSDKKKIKKYFMELEQLKKKYQII